MSIIFVLEDDPQAMSIVDFIESHGFVPLHAEELYSTVYFLENKPGLSSIDKLLFDLSVPRCEVNHSCGVPRDSTYTGKYAGLEYISDNYINWQEFQKAVDEGRVAILTAHDRGMQEEFNEKLMTTPGLCKVVVISKLADDLDELLIKFMNGN